MGDHWQDPELVWDFLAEAEEHLDRVDEALLELDKWNTERDKASVQEALRGLHSIKGTAGYVALLDIQELCHASESLLHGLELAPDGGRERLDLAFDGISVLRERLDEVRNCCQADRSLTPSTKVSEFLERANTPVVVAPPAR